MIVRILLVLTYNLLLLAGASYLYVTYPDIFNGWIFFLALCFGASWRDRKEE